MELLSELEKKLFNLIEEGCSYPEIIDTLHVSRRFIDYRVSKDFKKVLKKREIKLKKEEKFAKTIKKLIPQCYSIGELCTKLSIRGTQGYYAKIQKIIKKYNLDTSHFNNDVKYEHNFIKHKIPLNEYFKDNVKRNGKHTLKKLIDNNIKKYQCEKCKNTQWMGEKIPLEIHHINGKHNDNRLENIQILCPNCHAQTENFCGHNKQNNKKKNFCLDCGKEISYKAKYCKKCFYKHKRKVEMPNKEYLKKLIEEKPFLQIGKMFGVSDSAVRKWCKEYGLPYRKKDIK